MRTPLLAAAAVALLVLSGCASIAPAVGDAVNGPATDAQDLAAKAAVGTIKTAVVASLTDTPGELPAIADLAPWGYTPDSETGTASLAGTAEDFCVQVESLSGAVFHSELNGSVEDGAC